MDALEEREKQTEQEYVNVQQEEQQLVNELNGKYGPGSLDPQTGEFTPVEPTESAE
jgi:trehalose-6-phosphate synthase